jgi:anti-sigma regulatory factor (Ser/Thr protein kinase)
VTSAFYGRNLEELERIVEQTGRFFSTHGIDPSLRLKVDLSIEELFVNMVTYNQETRSDIRIDMKPIEGGIEVSLTDFNVDRFDPTEARAVDVESPLEDRVPGGLGLYLVMKMADSIDYRYCNRESRVTFTNRTAQDHV